MKNEEKYSIKNYFFKKNKTRKQKQNKQDLLQSIHINKNIKKYEILIN